MFSGSREVGRATVPDDGLPCVDPECEGRMYPEQDEDHRYLECVLCGYATGWAKVLPEPGVEVCAAGLTPDQRAAAGGDLAQPPPGPVVLGPTIGRRPGL